MNIPKEMKMRTFVVFLACMLIVSSVSVYYGLSASTPTQSLTDIYVEPPLMESSYVIGIYTSPSTCYLKNGTTGQIVTTGTFAVCFDTGVQAMTTGGKLFIRAGRYNLTAGISIYRSGVYIEGECLGGVGEPAVQIDAGITGVTNQLVTYTSVPTYSNNYLGGIKNIMFRGQSTVNSVAVTVEGFWSDLLFENCGFMYFDTGVKIYPFLPGSSKIWNIWFDQCLFEDNLKYGLYLTGTTHAINANIERVRVTNSHFYDNQNSIYCDTQYVYHFTFTDNTVQAERQSCINSTSGGRQWIISNNHIFDCGIGTNGTYAGIFVNGTGTFYSDSWLIENNIIANHYTSAPVAMNNSIWLTGTVTNFVIEGNFFFSSNQAIRTDGLTSYASIKVQGNLDYAKNLVFPTESNGVYSYIISAFRSTYYMLNCSTNNVDYQSTNLTKVEQFALGNMTTGLLYLKELAHNTSLTISASQMVQQQLINKITYFTSTGSSSIPDCPVSTSSTFTLTSDTTEHTIVTLTPTSVEEMCNFYLDMSALTQNCTLRVYITIGAGYVEMTSMTVTVAAGSKGLGLKPMVIDTNWKITIQSTIAEGSSRLIPYEYFVNVY